MSRKQRIIVSITGIVLVSLILIGLTYGYYLTKIKGNTNSKSISVTTANLLLEYADINDELISDSKVEPGKSWTKTFVATNKGNKTVTYGVALENVVNQLERKSDLVYTLECKEYLKSGLNIDTTNKTVTGTTSGTCNGVSNEVTFPSVGTILVQNSIEEDKAQVYTLVVTYKDVNEDQSVDMNKTFSAKVNIVDPNNFIPYGEGTLASAIINNALNVTNEQKELGYAVYRETPLSKPGESISEYRTGNVIEKGELDMSEQSTWYYGSTPQNARPWNGGSSEGTITECTDTIIGKYISYPLNSTSWFIMSCKSETIAIYGEVEVLSESTLSKNVDDYGTTYYYRGTITDNYVSFADKLWRIVRINGDGTIRLVLDDVAKDTSGNVIETAFNTSYNDNAYVGYMYGTPGSTTYDDTHKNINDSTIKTKVDAWYKTNIVDTNNSDYVADTLFCNDKTLADKSIGDSNTALGYGTNTTYYASEERLRYSTGTTSITTSKPTFKCADNATNDYSRFTVNVTTLPNGNKTNGKLTYPVGLLTADEVAYAGAYKYGEQNDTYYLYNSSISYDWWLSSPAYYNYSNPVFVWYVGYQYSDLLSLFATRPSTFRPVLNLKASVLVNQGDGTKENPYIISY